MRPAQHVDAVLEENEDEVKSHEARAVIHFEAASRAKPLSHEISPKVSNAFSEAQSH